MACCSSHLPSGFSSQSASRPSRRSLASTREKLRRTRSCPELDRWPAFLEHCALSWPLRLGADTVRRRSARSYDDLVHAIISKADADMIAVDVDRSSVDGIHDLDQRALGRMLYAWCSLAPGCYTQGLNFFAAVLLAVMLQSSGLPPPLAEERAFWTFCAALRVLYPADFHRPPFAGLQRLAGQMSALAAERLAVPAPVDVAEVADVTQIMSYSWFCSSFVGCVPLSTLLRVWDELLFTSGADGAGDAGHSLCPAAPLRLGLALLRCCRRRLLREMAKDSNDGVGLGFRALKRGSLRCYDAAALVRAARREEVRAEVEKELRAARIPHCGGSGRIGGGGELSPTHQPAPRWVADEERSACVQCELGFTVLRRRHHCRACGEVFCGDCSFARLCLPWAGHTPVRTCTGCARRLGRLVASMRLDHAGAPAAADRATTADDFLVVGRSPFIH